jgi:hypothetical protein
VVPLDDYLRIYVVAVLRHSRSHPGDIDIRVTSRHKRQLNLISACPGFIKQGDTSRRGHDCLKGKGCTSGKSIPAPSFCGLRGKEVSLPEVRNVAELRPGNIVSVDIDIRRALCGLKTAN